MRRSNPHCRRPGFTLVELLVVIIVIAMLIALLAPAIGGAIKAANAARVTAEINNMATALTQFKNNYSDYPPSRVVLVESGTYSTTSTTTISSLNSGAVQADITVGQLSQRTVRYMSKFFPRATCFSTTGGTKVDFNGDGLTTGTFYLDGGECLVFFLGGLPTVPVASNGGTAIGMSGFSRNPANPFLYSVATASFPASTSRTQPLFEFSGARLHDADGDGFPSYNDALSSGSQGRPYAYFSAYGGNAYDPNDCNFTDALGKSMGDTFSRTFNVNFSVDSNGGYSANGVCVSPAPNPYTSSPPDPGTSSASTVWQSPQTFQILSAGSNQIFGVGGQFAGNNATNRLPIPTTDTPQPPGWTGNVVGGPVIDDERNTEADNLSNFVSTRLNQ